MLKASAVMDLVVQEIPCLVILTVDQPAFLAVRDQNPAHYMASVALPTASSVHQHPAIDQRSS